jgi:hypothetical protein
MKLVATKAAPPINTAMAEVTKDANLLVCLSLSLTVFVVGGVPFAGEGAVEAAARGMGRRGL